MTTRKRNALALILGVILGAVVTVAVINAAIALPDPVVASDHADRLARAVSLADLPAAPVAAEPSPIDTLLEIAGPLGRGALGGIACLGAAWLLARARERWGWLRRGWAGNVAATCYAALVTFGAVVAVGGSVGGGLAAVGGAMVTGMALGRDPATIKAPVKSAMAGEVEVPT